MQPLQLKKHLRLKTTFVSQTKLSKLSSGLKNKAGRAKTGRIVARFRSTTKLKLRSISVHRCQRNIRLQFVSTAILIPFQNKLVSLCVFANGLLAYCLTTSQHRLFSYYRLSLNSANRRKFIWPLARPLFRFPKLTVVSDIEAKPYTGSKICLSAGSRTTLLTTNNLTKSSLLSLPSKKKKIIASYVVAQSGRILPEFKKKLGNLRAGYWRNFGINPVVRGVAKNPVDHPHGGRTKSIRYPRTPWGKTTKFK
jgi:large subunit ribosomal protein L2